jgi:hypothetical protein
VFYIFGASAVLWLPFWLPQKMEGGTGGGGGKGFSIRALFSTPEAGEASQSLNPERGGMQSPAAGSQLGSAQDLAAEGRRLRSQQSLPDDGERRGGPAPCARASRSCELASAPP